MPKYKAVANFYAVAEDKHITINDVLDLTVKRANEINKKAIELSGKKFLEAQGADNADNTDGGTET